MIYFHQSLEVWGYDFSEYSFFILGYYFLQFLKKISFLRILLCMLPCLMSSFSLWDFTNLSISLLRLDNSNWVIFTFPASLFFQLESAMNLLPQHRKSHFVLFSMSLRQGLNLWLQLFWNSLSRPGWPWIDRDPLVSALGFMPCPFCTFHSFFTMFSTWWNVFGLTL